MHLPEPERLRELCELALRNLPLALSSRFRTLWPKPNLLRELAMREVLEQVEVLQVEAFTRGEMALGLEARVRQLVSASIEHGDVWLARPAEFWKEMAGYSELMDAVSDDAVRQQHDARAFDPKEPAQLAFLNLQRHAVAHPDRPIAPSAVPARWRRFGADLPYTLYVIKCVKQAVGEIRKRRERSERGRIWMPHEQFEAAQAPDAVLDAIEAPSNDDLAELIDAASTRIWQFPKTGTHKVRCKGFRKDVFERIPHFARQVASRIDTDCTRHYATCTSCADWIDQEIREQPEIAAFVSEHLASPAFRDRLQRLRELDFHLLRGAMSYLTETDCRIIDSWSRGERWEELVDAAKSELRVWLTLNRLAYVARSLANRDSQ